MKKNKEYCNARLMDVTRFRWEFMRRDPEYHKAYLLALSIRLTSGSVFTDELASGLCPDEYYQSKGGQSEIKLSSNFYSKYDGVFIDNNIDFYSLQDLFLKSNRFIQPVTNEYAWVDFCRGYTDSAVSAHFYTNFGENARPALKQGEFLIKIDMHKINSKTELKKHITSTVDAMLQLAQTAPKHLGFDEHSAIRKSITDYEVILNAGDMHFTENKTYQQVAMMLNPRDFKVDNDSAKPESKVKTAQYYCDQYNSLVHGGWRALRYP